MNSQWAKDLLNNDLTLYRALEKHSKIYKKNMKLYAS